MIDAALREFSEKGYENASLNTILKEAGISKGTFYYHFANKEDLYFYLIELFIAEKKEFMAQAIKPEDYAKDIFTILKLQGRLGMEFMEHNPRVAAFSASFAKERGNEIYDKALQRCNLQDNNMFDFLIENAIKRGEIREDLPKEFVKNLFGYLFTHVLDMTNTLEVVNFQETLEYLVEFMKDGLARK